MIDIIEHLAQDQEWMDKFCKNCEVVKLCLCEYNPFYDMGCIREGDLREIEDMAEKLEIFIERVVA